MHTTIKLDIREINTYVTQAMIHHLGPSAASNNYSDVIVTLVENILHPYTDVSIGEVSHMLARRNIDLAYASDIVAVASTMVTRMIQPVFGRLIGEYLFEANYDNYGSIIIRNRGPIPKDPHWDELSVQEAFIERTLMAIDNGDWVCPKVRQMAGLTW